MSFAIPGLPRGYKSPQSDALTSFNGGVNLRDAASPSELAANEVVDSWNVTYDERGGASSRLGIVKYNTPAYGVDLIQNEFWPAILSSKIVNAGAKLYLGTGNTVRKTFTTSERVTFCEFGTYVVACHPTDGLWTSTDGITWSPVTDGLGVVTITIASPGVLTLSNHGLAINDPVYLTTSGALPTGLSPSTIYYVQSVPTSATFTLSATAGGAVINTSGTQSGTHHIAKGSSLPPVGICVATWQNKLWVGKTNGSVAYSNAGTPLAWTATDFNNIWTKDAKAVVALHVASGENILGKPLLYAFKQESWYVIEDSSTAAYSVVDATVGSASAISVVGVGPYVYALSRRGIFRAAGAQVGATDMSDKLAPLWDSGQTNLAQLDKWCAGRRKNRALFSLTRSGSTANDLALELHTEQGWIAPGSNAMSCYSMSTGSAETTYGGSPSVVGQSYQLYSGGTDDGVAISGWLQTRWIDLLGGYKASILHLRVRGRGTGTVEIRKDYHESGDRLTLDMSSPTSVTYDSGLHYDAGVSYYVPADEPTATLYGIGHCRQLSLKFAFTTSTTVSAPQLLGTGTAPLVGPFAVFLVEWMHMRIGIN